MAYFPMFIQLKGRKCLVVGGGKVALRKIKVLKDFEAEVTVVAPDIIEQIRQIDDICRIFRSFEEKDLKSVELVVAATDDKKENHRISQFCMEQNIPVNAVDQKEDCSFIFPSYIKEGEVVGAFSSSGQSPVITQYLKKKIRPTLTKQLGQISESLGEIREVVKKLVWPEKRRKVLYKELLNLSLEKNMSLDHDIIEQIILKYNEESRKHEWIEQED
ncbi:bifunctional precorrin-2 dehydrogenase/sirohydrochlorin ferrochelatase [Anaerostipes sp. MSJ-23]|nr:bifunctional precorrin-2 dehydrogenase/sirohydrochlorin ferrochelatase [Anaerostipes sp. MSJ-23]